MSRAAIGLGANLGDAATTVGRAVRRLGRLGRVIARSPLYGSRPWGVTDQPDFVNAVVVLETALTPHRLLRRLKAMERALGRRPSARWGPRAIDADILTYAGRRLATPALTIPHPRLAERAFALAPLADVDARYGPALAALPAADRADAWRIPSETARTPSSVDWDLTIERVRSAAAFCAEAGLARFRIDEADLEIEIRRAPRAARAAGPSAAIEPAVPSPSENGKSARAASADLAVLKAEFVGIVRFTRPTVVEGTVLANERDVAFVESLGIRNPVRARAGRVSRIFVADGEPVEFGQPLFAIEPQAS